MSGWICNFTYAPSGVNEAGITAPPNPAHGPWRRLSAQNDEADVRLVPEPGFERGLVGGLMLLAGWRVDGEGSSGSARDGTQLAEPLDLPES